MYIKMNIDQTLKSLMEDHKKSELEFVTPSKNSVLRVKKIVTKFVQNEGFKRNVNCETDKVLNFFCNYFYVHLNNQAISFPRSKFLIETKNGIVSLPKRFSYTKGMFIYGPPGTGKTMMAAIIARFFSFRFYSFGKMMSSWCSGSSDLSNISGNEPIVIDDFGSETLSKRYGVEFPISQLFDERWKAFEYRGVPTIFTSNIRDDKEVMSMFGERVYSRLFGMCNAVKFDGEDWRIK